MKNQHLHGFTLLELAIVLVIIGTILSAIIAGQSMLTTSRLQQVITDADSYANAVANFKQTYQALPGDFVTATTVWGTDNSAGGCAVGNTGTSGNGTSGTCNGSGNGMLLNTNSSGTLNSASEAGETFLFWQHLYLAGMLTQKVSNQAGSAGPYDSIVSGGIQATDGTSQNVPTGSIKGTGWSAIWFGTVTATSTGYCDHTNCFSSDTAGNTFLSYGNVLVFGKQASGAITYSAALTPDQAASIDAKIDDGTPATGKVRSFINGGTINPSCATSAAVTAAYNVSDTNIDCALIFVMGF